MYREIINYVAEKNEVWISGICNVGTEPINIQDREKWLASYNIIEEQVNVSCNRLGLNMLDEFYRFVFYCAATGGVSDGAYDQWDIDKIGDINQAYGYPQDYYLTREFCNEINSFSRSDFTALLEELDRGLGLETSILHSWYNLKRVNAFFDAKESIVIEKKPMREMRETRILGRHMLNVGNGPCWFVNKDKKEPFLLCRKENLIELQGDGYLYCDSIVSNIFVETTREEDFRFKFKIH